MQILGFLIWIVMGFAFVGLGIYCFLSKKECAFGFWANAEVFPVENVTSYNHALGKMWCIFGIIFCILGIPLLDTQNSWALVVPILGTMIESIGAMAFYVIVIERKYRKR